MLKDFLQGKILKSTQADTFCKKGNDIKQTPKKLFFCDECGNIFKDKKSLKDHKLRKHSEIPQIKPYQCSSCERSFFTPRELRTHEGVHSDARPHSCNECSKTFRRKGALVIHKRSHTGERPYPCDTCDKAFASSPRLNTHIRVH